MNINCVICSDLFNAAAAIFSTPCGHIFHHHCLLQWLEKSKSCPQCRAKCTQNTAHRIYFNQINHADLETECSASMQEKMDEMQLTLREKERSIKELNTSIDKILLETISTQKRHKVLKMVYEQKDQAISVMSHQIDLLKGESKKNKDLKAENESLHQKLKLMQSVESILTASQKDVEDIISENLSTQSLSTMVGALKRELNNNELRKNELRKQLMNVKNDLRAEQDARRNLIEKCNYYESENHRLSNKCEKFTKTDDKDVIVIEDTFEGQTGTPDGIKKSRFAMHNLDGCQNTPSPLGTKEFNERVTKIQDSTSPYMKIKSSSIGLAGLMKKPSEAGTTTNLFKRTVIDQTQLSIFKKAKLNTGLQSIPYTFHNLRKPANVLQSDLKISEAVSLAGPSTSTTKKIKRLAPLAKD
ncbi:unnamed protein product [Diamesa hyperborea]